VRGAEVEYMEVEGMSVSTTYKRVVHFLYQCPGFQAEAEGAEMEPIVRTILELKSRIRELTGTSFIGTSWQK
jgi:hypothetical protein